MLNVLLDYTDNLKERFMEWACVKVISYVNIICYKNIYLEYR